MGGGPPPHFLFFDEIFMIKSRCAENLRDMWLKFPSATFGTKMKFWKWVEHRQHYGSWAMFRPPHKSSIYNVNFPIQMSTIGERFLLLLYIRTLLTQHTTRAFNQLHSHRHKNRKGHNQVTKIGRFVKEELLITSIYADWPCDTRGRNYGGFKKLKSAVPDPPPP